MCDDIIVNVAFIDCLANVDFTGKPSYFGVIETLMSFISDKHHSRTLVIKLIHKSWAVEDCYWGWPFLPHLIREFTVNLPVEENDPSANEFQKVHVCGVCFNISTSSH